MALKAIMNQDGTIDHDAGSPVSGGSFVVTSTPSAFVKVNGKGIYRGPLSGTFTGGDAAGFVSGSVTGTWVINPTAAFVKVEGLPVVREDDVGTLSGVGTIDPPAVPPTGPVVGSVVVADSGQGDVNGD